jgi:hypothetical protein
MDIFENWAETKAALLEGLSPAKQAVVAPLLENQKNQLLSENAAAGATVANDIAGFRKILIPMIRRIIPGTIATELVGVQPMSGPVGLVYTLRYRYGEPVAGVNAAKNPFGLPAAINPGDEVFGNISPIRSWYSGGVSTTGAFPTSGQEAGSSGIGAFGTPDEIGQGGNAAGGNVGTAEAWDSATEAWSTANNTSLGLDHGFGPYADPTGVTLGGQFAGSLYGGSGSYLEGSGGRRMNLDIVSQAVEAGSRKLQAGWTIEAMQDLNAQHGLDLESEMTQALSAEIVQEIDQEIITDLISLAGTVDTFDGAGAGQYGGSGAGNYKPTFIGDRLANLGVIINRVANEIARKTRRGAGNYIVVSPLVVSVLQSASKSVFAPAIEGSFKGPNNTMMVGTLNGTIKVYSYLWNQAGVIYPGGQTGDLSSPGGGYQATDTILVGYKGGNGETDSGYFYCPYIPLMSSGVVVNPVTFQPVVSLMTRYGKAVFTSANTSLGNSADYYGKITTNNLDLR